MGVEIKEESIKLNDEVTEAIEKELKGYNSDTARVVWGGGFRGTIKTILTGLNIIPENPSGLVEAVEFERSKFKESINKAA